MERYTKRLSDNQAAMNCDRCKKEHIQDQEIYCSALYCRNRLKDRVAAYEDTGLEPDEIKAMCGIPCKIGEIVYQTNQTDVFPLHVKKIIFDCGHVAFDASAIGESVFLRIEEAHESVKENQDG